MQINFVKLDYFNFGNWNLNSPVGITRAIYEDDRLIKLQYNDVNSSKITDGT
jgi:hypothetical protein